MPRTPKSTARQHIWRRSSWLSVALVTVAVASLFTPLSAQASEPSWTPDEVISTPGTDSYSVNLVASPSGEVTALWQEEVVQGGLVGGAFPLIARTRSAAGSWGAPVIISAVDRTGYTVGTSHSTAGDLTVVIKSYAINPGSGGIIDVSIEAITRSPSGTWGTAVEISPFRPSIEGERISQSGAGELTVSWIELTNTVDTLFTRTRSVQGIWGSPVAISIGDLDSYSGLTVSPSGDATALWARDAGGGLVIESRVRPAGGVWGPVTSLGAGFHLTSFVAPNGDVTAVWQDRNAMDVSVLRAASRSEGGTWDSAIELSGGGQAFPGTPDERAIIAASSTSEVTVMWQEFGSSEFTYQVRTRTRSSTGAWGAVRTMSDLGAFAQPTEVVSTRNGEVAAFWEQSGNTTAFATSTRSAGGAWSGTTTVVPNGGDYPWLLDVANVGATNDLVAVWSAYPPLLVGEVRARLRTGGTWGSQVTLSSPDCDISALGNGHPPQVVSTSDGQIVAVWTCTTASGTEVHSRSLSAPEPLSGVGSAASQGVLAGLAVSTPNLESFDATSGGLVQTRAAGPPFARPTDSVSGQVAVSLSISGGSLGGVPMAGQVDFARSAIGPSSALPGTALTFIPFARDALTFGVSVVSDMPRDIALGNATQDARPVPLFTLRNIYRGVVTSFIDSGANTVTIRPVLPPVGSETRQWWLDALGLTEQQLGSTVVTAVSGEFDGGSVVAPGDIVPFSVSQYIAQGNYASLPAPLVESRAQLVLGQVDTVQVMVRDANDALHANPDATISRPLFVVVETARLSGTSAQDAALQAMFEGPTSTLCSSGPLVQQYGLAPIGTSCGNTDLYTQALRVE